MLRDSGCAVSQKFRHHFQAYSPVQAPGSIGVPGDVGEDRLVYPAEAIDRSGWPLIRFLKMRRNVSIFTYLFIH